MVGDHLRAGQGTDHSSPRRFFVSRSWPLRYEIVLHRTLDTVKVRARERLREAITVNVLQLGRKLIPLEVKWTQHPKPHDARQVSRFLDDHPREATHGFLVFRAPRPQQLEERITAIPWFCL